MSGGFQGASSIIRGNSTSPRWPSTSTTRSLAGVTESSDKRLAFDHWFDRSRRASPDPALFRSMPRPRAPNIGFQAANTVTVKDLVVGIQSSVVETMPVFQDLGGGDLATLLNNANISVSPDDSLIVIGSTDGQTPDIVAVAQGQEGAQNSFSPTELGLITDTCAWAPVSGSGAGLHFYELTSYGIYGPGDGRHQSFTAVGHRDGDIDREQSLASRRPGDNVSRPRSPRRPREGPLPPGRSGSRSTAAPSARR